MSTPTEEWDRLPGESEKAFHAFRAYLEIGPGRSVVDAYRQRLRKKSAKQADGTWNGWAKRYRWRHRADAFDSHVSKLKDRKIERATLTSAELWVKERDTQIAADLEIGRLFMARSKDLATFPVTDLRVEDAGGPLVLRAIDPRWIAEAARIANVGRAIVWGAIEAGLGAEKERAAAAPPPPLTVDAVRDAERMVLELREQFRRRHDELPDRPPGDPPNRADDP